MMDDIFLVRSHKQNSSLLRSLPLFLNAALKWDLLSYRIVCEHEQSGITVMYLGVSMIRRWSLGVVDWNQSTRVWREGHSRSVSHPLLPRLSPVDRQGILSLKCSLYAWPC
jgi:hypothetical protein